MQLSKEFFDNRKEQAKIKLAVVAAIPVNVRYDNLVIALSELLNQYMHQAFKEEETADK